MTGTAITAANLPLDNSFATLPPEFYTRLRPTPLPAPYLVGVSPQAAALLGLDAARLGDDDFLAILAGNAVPDRADPLAAVYSGHQFGVWAGQLGDGRAILLGEDRKSTRLNSSHLGISYAGFCLKKKNAHSAGQVRKTQAYHGRADALGIGAPERRRMPPFFFNDPATTEIYTLSLHDALPI